MYCYTPTAHSSITNQEHSGQRRCSPALKRQVHVEREALQMQRAQTPHTSAHDYLWNITHRLKLKPNISDQITSACSSETIQ